MGEQYGICHWETGKAHSCDEPEPGDLPDSLHTMKPTRIGGVECNGKRVPFSVYV